MDLELGLAVWSNPLKGFDLNSSESEIIDVKRKRDVGFAATSSENSRKKRSIDYERVAAFVEKINYSRSAQTLPSLQSWARLHKQGDNQDDLENKDGDDRNSSNDGVLVGWPPINPLRKRIYTRNHHGGGSNANYVTVENGGGNGPVRRSKNYMFVKVKMEGMGIGRKVDLSLHHSHETLVQTLIAMFGKCRESAGAYQLLYQDKNGCWQPAEDACWGVFVDSVQRLKMVWRNPKWTRDK